MNRVTPAQRRLLIELADGAVIRTGRAGVWLRRENGMVTVIRWQTAEALRVRGWLTWPERGKDHTITPAGLAAIGRNAE